MIFRVSSNLGDLGNNLCSLFLKTKRKKKPVASSSRLKQSLDV